MIIRSERYEIEREIWLESQSLWESRQVVGAAGKAACLERQPIRDQQGWRDSQSDIVSIQVNSLLDRHSTGLLELLAICLYN